MMTMKKMPGMYSCREVHEFVATGMVDELGFMARMKFKMHVMMCHHCARYVRQIKALGYFVREAFGGAPDPERCQRIEDVVMAQCDGHH